MSLVGLTSTCELLTASQTSQGLLVVLTDVSLRGGRLGSLDLLDLGLSGHWHLLSVHHLLSRLRLLGVLTALPRAVLG